MFLTQGKSQCMAVRREKHRLETWSCDSDFPILIHSHQVSQLPRLRTKSRHTQGIKHIPRKQLTNKKSKDSLWRARRDFYSSRLERLASGVYVCQAIWYFRISSCSWCMAPANSIWEHLQWAKEGFSMNSCLLIYIREKVDGETRMDPVIQTHYLHSGEAIILFFIVLGSRTVISFCIPSSNGSTHVCTTRQQCVGLQDLANVPIELHDRFEGCLMVARGLDAKKGGLEEIL